jgi:putative hydrolase of the HAD superfamily
MIKVLIFDFDGVLNHNKRKFSVMLEKDHGISLEQTTPFFTGPFQECLSGERDLKDSITPYLKDWGWRGGVDQLLAYWFALEDKVDQKVVDYIQDQRGRGVVCMLATNNEKHRFQYILNEMDLEKVFDKAYSSGYIGYKKPEQEFFAKIYNELENIDKSEILFIDDSVENIQGAKDFGIHAEHYTSFEDFLEKVKKYQL